MTTLQKTICASLVLLSVAGAGPLWAEDGVRRIATQIKKANGLLRDGDVDGAIAAYRQAQESAPASSDLAYNLAVAQYRKGDVSAAAKQFRSVAAADNNEIAARARFNLGNCDYVSALQLAEKDRPAAIERLQSAIGNYRAALSIDSSDADARANIELAVELIDKLREKDKQQQQQQDQQQQDQQQQDQQQQDQQQQDQQQQDQQQQDQQQQDQQQSGQQQSGQQQSGQQQSGQQQSGQQQDQQQSKPQSGHVGDKQRQKEKQHEEQNQSQSAQGSEYKKDKSELDQPQQQNNQSKNDRRSEDQPASKQQNQKNETQTGEKDNTAARRQPVPSRPQQDATTNRQEDRQAPLGDQPNDHEGKAAPKGKLSAAQQSDKNDKHNRRTLNADERSDDGEMTAQEAEKMLQAIRDREMIRRLRRQAAERNRHISVDRDW